MQAAVFFQHLTQNRSNPNKKCTSTLRIVKTIFFGTIFNVIVKNDKQTEEDDFMKMLKFGLVALLISSLFYSCNKDDGYSLGDYWITIGNIEGDSEGFVVVTDGGTRLFPSANAVPGYPLEDGDRLWTNYTILGDGEENSDIDHYVKINGFSHILTKGIFELTPDKVDSIGHDPVWVKNPEEDIWIANDYLNIFFWYEGSPWVTHFINVVSDVDEPTTPEGMPILELRHNKNGDAYTTPYLNGFVSIDLTSLQQDGINEVTFLLRAKGLSGEYELETEMTYTYGDAGIVALENGAHRTSFPTDFNMK
jgi:hypothetical protein